MTHQTPPPAPCEGTPGGGHRAPTAGAAQGPAVGARTITPDQAAWVRAQVWTQSMRKTHSEVPGFYSRCACQAGLTHWCKYDRHESCHRATPLPGPAAHIVSRAGHAAFFTEPYEHLHLTATGRHQSAHAMVWLADRICRWLCDCSCGHPKPAVVPVQEELFAGVG